MTTSDMPDPDNLPVDPAEIEQVDVKQVHDEQRGEAPALVDPDRTRGRRGDAALVIGRRDATVSIGRRGAA